ncbi:MULTISPECIES: hypothetical protein [Rhizobium]|uniref:Uncharacterized protein n=2 Tax=Rhizobium leguminosarum TaxID=384 RepID=A0A154IFU1_RHILE|nr:MULTISPECIES: hypothetical protein [Rhizobium]KAF5887039.1 hypothetical protein FY112_04720 [Rhizobium sp. PEPV16]KZA99458.1 hypothetical protein A4A59_22090 [Rhizobium leguminosarum]MBY5770943.1 hypothetical protein [Rhizobium leguminosarum]MBY5795739.1 hypothetical protein [Rhizobium leguminosarum]NKM98443.1 hypothetical protein [Rhizobium leguminosarum bv. viciae]
MTSAAARVWFEGKLLLPDVVPPKVSIQVAPDIAGRTGEDRWNALDTRVKSLELRRRTLKVRDIIE